MMGGGSGGEDGEEEGEKGRNRQSGEDLEEG